MKKRILSLVLTLCLLAGLLPCLTMGAAAASRVDAAPYASVEYAKNADVKTGTCSMALARNSSVRRWALISISAMWSFRD